MADNRRSSRIFDEIRLMGDDEAARLDVLEEMLDIANGGPDGEEPGSPVPPGAD